MKKENTVMFIGIIIVILLLLIGSAAIKSASGVNPPFTVIESQSMQHSGESQIGIIDTADMILVKSPDKTEIKTLVEGYSENYETFGDHGSVIIYKRDVGNPVIHRALAYLSFNNDHWECPSLKYYLDSNGQPLWSCSSGDDCNNMSGTLTIKLIKDYRKVESVTIHLNNLAHESGYVTMGDNNSDIDQNSSISSNKLVKQENIKSVAWKEIPWIGALKLISKGELSKVQTLVPNTIPNMIAFVFTIILIIISIGFIVDEISIYKIKKKYGL